MANQSVQADEIKTITMGSLIPTSAASDLGYDLAGRAMLVRGDSTTEAYVHITGLTASSSYGAHVHNLPCDVNAGGGHYQFVEDGPADETNEIWPSVETDATGIGSGYASVEHVARPEAQSIVVHNNDDDKTRLACADLTTGDTASVVYEGEIADYASAAEEGYSEISGLAQLVRSNGRTFASVSVFGLTPGAQYMTHVHDLPCDVEDGGGHYMIDPNGAADEENEMWPTVTVDENGVGSGEVDIAHIARPEAQAVVIHAESGNRIACATLESSADSEGVETSGTPLTTPTGIARGYNIGGLAQMVRTPEGYTYVGLQATGLETGKIYMAHVHNLPCSMGGGGHYQHVVGGPANDENEIWLTLTPGGGRWGAVSNSRVQRIVKKSVTTPHTVRPEAQSVVIHDPDDSERLACFDLD